MSEFKQLHDIYPDIDALDRDHPIVENFEELPGEPFDFERRDINYYALGKIPTMLATARKALVNASSHRGFEVAAVGLYEDREGGLWEYTDSYGDRITGEGPRIVTVATANFKTKVRDEDRDVYDVEDISKNCAETNGLIIADNGGYQRLHTIGVVATSNRRRIEGVNFEQTPTLCLCAECIRHFKHNPLVDDDTMIITAGSAENVMEIRSNKQLQRAAELKKRGEPAKSPHVQTFREADWPVRQARYRAQCKSEKLGYKRKNRDRCNQNYSWAMKLTDL